MFQCFACETITGRMIDPIDVNVKTWTRELNGSDSGSVLLSPGPLTLATRDSLRVLTTPQRMTLVIEWLNDGDQVGVPVFAGPFVNRQWDGKAVTLNAVGARSILAARKLINWTPPYTSQVLSFTGMSLGSIGVKVVQFATSGPGCALPIVFPTIEVDSDPTHVETYNGFDLKTADSALSDLTGRLNGPDFDFTPVWSDSNRTAITYQMRAGTNEQPKLLGVNPVAFDATQPESSVRLFTVLDDGSNVATRQWGDGSGTDVDTLMSTATDSHLTDQQWPVLERQKDYKSETVQALLDADVQGDLATNGDLLEQYALTVDAAAAPLLGSYPLGNIARVNVRNHVWLPAGDIPLRIIGMSGDATSSVKLTVQGA